MSGSLQVCFNCDYDMTFLPKNEHKRGIIFKQQQHQVGAINNDQAKV